MVERGQRTEAREGADGVASGLEPEVADPMIEVVLDAGAADQQGSGVNDDVHVL
jgi:hypothetical protein